MGWLAFKRKMDVSVFTFCFYFTGMFVAVFSQSCEQAHYNRCLKQLLHFTERGNLIFAPTSEQLHQECVLAQTALGCITRYTKKCLPLDDRNTFAEQIAGHHKLTMGICGEDSDLKKSYLDSLPCIRNMSEGLEYCKEKYDRNQRDIVLMEYEDRVHIECCSFDGYRRCLQMVVDTQDACRDEKVAMVIDDIATRKGGAFFEGACAEHFERCTGSGANRMSAFSLITLFFSIFISILYMKRAYL